ncbi:PfkB family carbohydrate kinase [Caulobacter segnis]|uniref:carbohydrate kinase family protein n=1 Tax=Caulobacter segnis TaxID=88688 RepID=UPI00240FABD5|nr:PfkB family carbohydrate kinase [Caulobacter segnis]MDG2520327.1 PfkB family carbohydrate kinase [Caulobacter segnis]
MTKSLMCVGLTTLDVTARAIDALPEKEGTVLVEGIAVNPAGTAAGAALIAARLGLEVSLLGAVGDDFTGRCVQMGLREGNVSLDHLAVLPGFPTSTTVLAVDSQGRRPNFHALGAGLFAEVDDAALKAAGESRFVHYGGIGGPKLDGGEGARLLKAAKAGGALVTLDLISPQPTALQELEQLAPYVDFLLPSAEEARFLTGQDDLAAAAEALSRLGPRGVFIKDGPRGVVAHLDGVSTRISAHDIRPVDTTSCGDAFCAAFIRGLAEAMTPLDAARFAVAAAALVAQGLGVFGALRDFDTVVRAMHDLPLKD